MISKTAEDIMKREDFSFMMSRKLGDKPDFETIDSFRKELGKDDGKILFDELSDYTKRLATVHKHKERLEERKINRETAVNNERNSKLSNNAPQTGILGN